LETTVSGVAQVISAQAASLFGVSSGLVLVRNGDELELAGHSGLDADVTEGLHVGLSDERQPAVRAVKTGTTIVDNDLRATMPDGPFSQQLGMQCLLAIPLIARQGPTGCLIIGDTQRKRRFNQEAADEAMLLGPLASSALERARLFADVQLREEHFRSLIENAADVI